MPSIPENIILKSLQDIITDEEAEILNLWLKEEQKNVEYYWQLEEIWNSSKRISEETVLSGWNKLLLDIEKCSPQKLMTVKSRQQKPLLWIRYIAAVFVGILISSVIWLKYSRFEDKTHAGKMLVQNVVCNNNGVRFLEFPDGSRTWINGFGKVTYPDCFDDQKRIVLLEGKAYFDVKKDVEKPFIVRSNNVDIEVTGTELFVDFTSENQLKVILITGSVNVHCKNEEGEEIISSLIPGQQADINRITGEIAVTATNTDYYTAWKDGTYRFKDIPLEKIMTIVSRYYDMDIQVDATLKTKRFTGRITPDDDMKDVMTMISRSFPIQYKITGKRVMIRPL